MDSDPVPTSTSPYPADDAEVLSHEAPGQGETVPEAPQGGLPDSGSRGDKAPESSEFGSQPNTALEPPVVPDSGRRPPSKGGETPVSVTSVHPEVPDNLLKALHSASQRFHRRGAPYYYECGGPEGSVRQERID